jgi:hypothetical protein
MVLAMHPKQALVSVPVQAGQQFCFVQHTDGNAGSGAATTVITMFEVASTTTVALTSANTALPPSSGGAPEETKYCITPSTDVNVEFDWSYLTTETTTNWDPFGYSVGGIFTQLSVDGATVSQTGTESILITSGTQFCFVQAHSTTIMARLQLRSPISPQQQAIRQLLEYWRCYFSHQCVSCFDNFVHGDSYRC